jgi:hypothetical protein
MGTGRKVMMKALRAPIRWPAFRLGDHKSPTRAIQAVNFASSPLIPDGNSTHYPRDLEAQRPQVLIHQKFCQHSPLIPEGSSTPPSPAT